VLQTLKNGTRVIIQENHATPVVAIQVWVGVGSADEKEGVAGIAHVVEHMLFKGTERRGVGDIAKEIEGAGGDINAWTSFDQTVYHVVMASRYFKRGLDVLADALRYSQLDGDELDRELNVILEELSEGEDSPTRRLANDLFSTAYKVHPYGRPVIGTADTIKAMSRAKLKRFMRDHYSPDNLTISVVGDIKAANALKDVERLFGGGEKGRRRSKRAVEPKQDDLRISIREKAVQESQISLGFHIPGIEAADLPALDLAGVIAGHGEVSKLVRALRREKEIVTDVYAYAYAPQDPGMWIAGATLLPDKLLKAVSGLSKEIFLLRRELVSASELERAKAIAESESVYQRETVQGQARKLAFYETVTGRIDFDEAYNARVAETTANDILKVAQKYFTRENLTVAVVCPKERKGLEASLRTAVNKAWTSVDKTKPARKGKSSQSGSPTLHTLANGARLIAIKDSSVPLLSIRAVWNGGLRAENARTNGINNLIAGLITRGTKTRSYEQVNEAIEKMAGSISGFSGKNSVGMRADFLARHWERGLDVFADCMCQPEFESVEVERLKREALEDLDSRLDNPAARVMRLFAKTLYLRHPYRFDVLGDKKTVSSFSREQLARYYKKLYGPSDAVIAMVGDIDPEEAIRRVEALLGGAAKKRVSSAKGINPPRELLPKGPREAHETIDKEQAHLVIGYPGTTLRHKDRFALEVLMALLSGQGGRLFVELRDRQGLAYRISAYSLEGVEAGHIAVYMATAPEKVDVAIKGITAELDRVKEKRVSQSELARVKRYLVGNYEVGMQRRSTLASYIAFGEAYGLGHDSYAQYGEQILAVTADDLRRVARGFLRQDRQILATVRPA
jgi:zinc protease